MSILDENTVSSALQLAGFTNVVGRKPLFIVNPETEISPAYIKHTYKKNKMIRIGGGIGLYFPEFEKLWREKITNEERKHDLTLPLIMAIDNYLDLIDGDVFRYTNDFDFLLRCAAKLYEVTCGLPQSIGEFGNALSHNLMLGFRVAEYLHIFPYMEHHNLYRRRSISFIHWFMSKYPEFRSCFTESLTDFQRGQL